jgi:hypothetical protein
MSRCMALRLRIGIACTSLAALAGCVSSSVPPPQSPRVPPVEKPDAFYDWHPLAIAPFGTLLKEMPVGLHEALLFRDSGQGDDGRENGDCYALEGAPPSFLGRPADEYLLCFDHDRLSRIEASARLSPDGGGTAFAEACARWRAIAAPPAAPPATEPGSCAGRDGAVAFRASFSGAESGSLDVVSISLFSAADSTP